MAYVAWTLAATECCQLVRDFCHVCEKIRVPHTHCFQISFELPLLRTCVLVELEIRSLTHTHCFEISFKLPLLRKCVLVELEIRSPTQKA